MYASDILSGGLYCNSFKTPVLSYKNRQTKNWLAFDIVDVFLQYIEYPPEKPGGGGGTYNIHALVFPQSKVSPSQFWIRFYEDYSPKRNTD